MRVLSCIAAFLLLPLLAYGAPPIFSTESGPELERSIAKLSRLLGDGVSVLYQKGTRITYTRLPSHYGPKRKAAIVLFTIEGYNGYKSYRQFLAVFFRVSKLDTSRNLPYNEWRLSAVTLAGHSTYRSFDSIVVKGKTIELYGHAWANTDPTCCPSATAHAAYKFSPYALLPSPAALPKTQSNVSRQSLPPAPVIVPGACPFEGCQYGKWTAREAVPMYFRPGGPVLKEGIAGGQIVTAASGEVWATPQKATVIRTYKTDIQQGINVGSVVYPLYPVGEGAVAVWHQGKVKEGSMVLDVQYDQPVESLHWTWWVRVILADGTTGWVKNPQHHFDGTDRYG